MATSQPSEKYVLDCQCLRSCFSGKLPICSSKPAPSPPDLIVTPFSSPLMLWKLFSDEVLNFFFPMHEVRGLQCQEVRGLQCQDMDYDFRHDFCFIVFNVKEINLLYQAAIDHGLVGVDNEF